VPLQRRQAVKAGTVVALLWLLVIRLELLPGVWRLLQEVSFFYFCLKLFRIDG
jgi:hypothetical protein